jgi:hypothetical protein
MMRALRAGAGDENMGGLDAVAKLVGDDGGTF